MTNKKILIGDIIGMVNGYTKLTIRDVTTYPSGAPGPMGDGIIYKDTCESLTVKHERILSMEVINISPQHEYCDEVSLYIVAKYPKTIYKCDHCGSVFTTTGNGTMMSHMCARCGYEMHLDEVI